MNGVIGVLLTLAAITDPHAEGVFTTANIIAAVALVVSGLAIWRAEASQSRANGLQRRLVVIEEAREDDRVMEKQSAQLVGRLIRERVDGRLSEYLAIENRGGAQARGIEIMLDGIPLQEHATYLFKDEPVHPELGPYTPYEYRLGTDFDTEDPKSLTIIWQDDAGGGRFSSPVSFAPRER
jgi:hypothetical protein